MGTIKEVYGGDWKMSGICFHSECIYQRSEDKACLHPIGFVTDGRSECMNKVEVPENVLTPDMVNHPPHYEVGGYESIKVMIAVFGKEAVKNFCKLNAFKYIWRSDRKNGIEDLKKAVWYLNKYMELERQTDEQVTTYRDNAVVPD